jgi:hypothetical protein
MEMEQIDQFNPEGFENANENELDLSVVDRNLLQGRTMGNAAKISDLDRVHSDVIRVEDGVNRTVRLLNRRVTLTNLRVQQISEEINAGFRTIGERMDGLSGRIQLRNEDNIEILEREPLNNNGEGSVHNNTPPESPRDGERTNHWIDDEPIVQINMVSAENNQVLPNFSSDSVIEFDRWTKKFVDFLEFHGEGWTEAKKLSRFKLSLDGMPRRIFDNLAAAEKDTLQNALRNVRAAMDSPQRRELTYQALAACKQKDGETVKTFLDRLIPLVEATSDNHTAAAKEEILCRTLLEKLKPEISFILRMAGLTGRRNFEELCMQAQEAEMMLVNKPKEGNPLQQANAVSEPNPPSLKETSKLGHQLEGMLSQLVNNNEIMARIGKTTIEIGRISDRTTGTGINVAEVVAETSQGMIAAGILGQFVITAASRAILPLTATRDSGISCRMQQIK